MTNSQKATRNKYYLNNHCPDCGSNRIHRSRLRPGERSPSNWNLMPMRCRDCKARFWVKNRDAYIVASVAFMCSLLLITFIWIIISLDEISIDGKKFDKQLASNQSNTNQPSNSFPTTYPKAAIEATSTQQNDVVNQSMSAETQYSSDNAHHHMINLFLNRANEGNAEAQHQLGQLYLTGNGTLQDFEEAVKWFSLAAEQNHAPAQYELGLLYHIGQGVNIDNEKSYMWLNLSAAAGLENAILARDKVARSLSQVQLVQAQKAAREWLNSKAKKNNNDSPNVKINDGQTD